MLNRIYNKVIRIIFGIIRKTNQAKNLLLSQKKLIINPELYGDSLIILKEKSIERVYFSKIFNLAEESWIDFLYPKIEVRRFTNAQVYSSSDFIVTKDGAIWGKYYKPQWSKNSPLDKDLLKINDQCVFIKKPKNQVVIDYGYSLCGVHCTTWAHFLVQYLPKLYLLKVIQSIVGYEITVILPIYIDHQIRDIVFPYISQLKNLKVLELNPDEVVNCKTLYYLENTSYISDHANYINPSDIIIPHFTIESLKKNLVEHFTDNLLTTQDERAIPYRKIYIGRSGYRNIINNDEIENYFVSQGFEVILPHKLTLCEKVNIFREA